MPAPLGQPCRTAREPAASSHPAPAPAGGRLEAVSSSARWEDVVGYSRAVKRGPFIFVSGELKLKAKDEALGCWCRRAEGRWAALQQAYVQGSWPERQPASSCAPTGTSAVDQASGRVLYRRDAYKQVGWGLEHPVWPGVQLQGPLSSHLV